MAFKEYREVAAHNPLILRCDGKDYIIPELSVDSGIRVLEISETERQRRLGNVDATAPSIEGHEWLRLVLGTAYDEMVADGVPVGFATRAAQVAYADYLGNRETAEIIWEAGDDPKALEEVMKSLTNRATRRAAPKRSNSTGAAKKTPSRASTSGTKTSRKV